jgi:alanyl-tRNA synthetase
LLHAALRQVLGTHVEQKGSLVNADHLRFDFSHFQKMTDEEIEKVEEIVNAKIRLNSVLEENRSMPIAEAKNSGAMMLFGEKYGEAVRVIKFGESVELCGGTHVSATGNIGMLKIISESAIAAGVRRIEAITAARAEKYVNDQIKTLNSVRETIKGSKDILGSVAALLQQNSELSKQLESFQRESLKIIKANLKSKVLYEKGVNIISGIIEIDDAALIKDLAFQLKGEVEDLYLVLGAEIDGKPNLTIMISENIVEEKGLDAAKIVREAGREIQGGGGGQSFYATAGGKNAAGLQAAIEKALSFL